MDVCLSVCPSIRLSVSVCLFCVRQGTFFLLPHVHIFYIHIFLFFTISFLKLIILQLLKQIMKIQVQKTNMLFQDITKGNENTLQRDNIVKIGAAPSVKIGSAPF